MQAFLNLTLEKTIKPQQALVARTTPLFSNFLFTNLFSIKFFISLLFHLFFLILTCSCQYSYNIMSTSNCMCRPYIDTNNTILQSFIKIGQAFLEELRSQSYSDGRTDKNADHYYVTPSFRGGGQQRI